MYLILELLELNNSFDFFKSMKMRTTKGMILLIFLWLESEQCRQQAGVGRWHVLAAAAWFLCKNIANFAPVPRTSVKMSRSSNNPAPAHNFALSNSDFKLFKQTNSFREALILWLPIYPLQQLRAEFAEFIWIWIWIAGQQQCRWRWWRWSLCLSLKSCTSGFSPHAAGDCLHSRASNVGYPKVPEDLTFKTLC